MTMFTWTAIIEVIVLTMCSGEFLAQGLLLCLSRRGSRRALYDADILFVNTKIGQKGHPTVVFLQIASGAIVPAVP